MKICVLLLLCFGFCFPDTLQACSVVASTTWTAALARGAGADEVCVIAPETLQHPPDYDPKPSDILAVSTAKFVLLGGFEGFATRMVEASGASAQVVEVHLQNSPESIVAEVTRLGVLFGTSAKAQQFTERFMREYARLKTQLAEHFTRSGRRAVVHVFMKPWASFAGFQVVGEFGPGPLQAGELLALSRLQPDIILDNAHMPLGQPLVGSASQNRVLLRNFPGPGEDLLGVFRANAQLLQAVKP